MKRILSVLLIVMFAALGNTAICTAAKDTSTAKPIKVSQKAINPFEDKTIKATLTTSLKNDFESKNYGSPIDWTTWFRPYPSIKTINPNALRIQLVGKEDTLSFVNIEIYSKYIKSAKDSDNVFVYAENIYNLMFPQWAGDDFLKKNLAALTKDSSVTITRDNIVFEFSYFEKSNLKQIIITPKH